MYACSCGIVLPPGSQMTACSSLSEDMVGLVRVEGEWLVLEVQPGSAHHRRLDVYRTELALLGRSVEGLLAAQR